MCTTWMGENEGTTLSRRAVVSGFAVMMAAMGTALAATPARADELIDDPRATPPVIEPRVAAATSWQAWACDA